MFNFQGWLPDADPAAEGVLKDVTDILPTVKGYRAAATAVDANFSAVSAAANSLIVVEKLDGSRRTFAGTATTLEEALGTSWTDRTRAVGGAYSCGSGARWSFAQFANATLAANYGDTMQVSVTGAFADISGAPKASYIAVSEGFVMAANINTSANPNHTTDGFHISAYNDYTDWTESVGTQCTSGRLIGGGQITGVKKLGSGFLVFKQRSMYVGRYVGAPIVFEFNEVSGDIGCVSNDAAVDVGDRIAFMGNDDFYIFDGARPVSIGEGVREWFFSDAKNTELNRTIATYNPATGNITWHYVSNDGVGTTPDRAIVFSTRSGKWGKYNITIEAAANYLGDNITWANYDNYYTDWDDSGTGISWRSLFFMGGIFAPAVIEADHILYTLTGAADTSSITMHNIGNNELFSTIKKVKPRFIASPTSSTLTYSYDNLYGDAFIVKNTATLSDNKYDLLNSARWHECQLNFVGDMEITGAAVTSDPDGLR